MDTITHFALGACIGEVVSGKKLGKIGLAIGGVSQLVPDVDFIFGLWMDPASNALAHRGFTHSILFWAFVSPLLAWLARRLWKDKSLSFVFWLTVIGLQIGIHILLDAFNAYGTGWFEPFSHYRVSFNTLFVADPFFSIPPGIAFALLVILRKVSTIRYAAAIIGIAFSSFYIIYSLANKSAIEKSVSHAFTEQSIPANRHFTTPTPFNNWLWYIVASNEAGSYVGYRSVFDESEHVDFEFFPRNDSLLKVSSRGPEIKLLKRLSQGYYTVELNGDTLLFNDLRFGQMVGWKDPKAGFVFHYYLSPVLDNTLVLQRGRFANWDWEATQALLRRIAGNK